MQKLILVLGSSGQLGSEIKAICNDYSNFTFYFANRNEIDLQAFDLLSLIENHRPSYVINCAAYTAVDKAEADQEKALVINGKAMVTLSEAVKNLGATLIHISSDYVYHNQNKRGPLTEIDECYPQSIYANSKLLGENNIRSSIAEHIILRTSWLYSSFGNNFVKTMLKLSETKKELQIVSDQIGAPTYARDLAHSICKIIQVLDHAENKKQLYGTYNFANEGVTSWFDFAKEIFRIKQIEVNVLPTTTKAYNAPAPRPLWSVMSKKKIKENFHLQIDHWRQALIRMLNELNDQ